MMHESRHLQGRLMGSPCTPQAQEEVRAAFMQPASAVWLKPETCFGVGGVSALLFSSGLGFFSLGFVV